MRKKIFATLMSVAIVASFMPSIAFAAHTCTYVIASKDITGTSTKSVTWDKIKGLSAEDAKFVNVKKEPTHTKAGEAELICKDSVNYCTEDPMKVEITTLPTNVDTADHKFSNRDLTLDEYAKAMLKQEEDGFKNEIQANKWVKDQQAEKKCYVKDVRVCSCGYVVKSASPDLQGHQAPNASYPTCKDYTCSKCNTVIKGGKHNPTAPTTKEELAALEVVSKPTCGHGTGYKVKCSNSGCDEYTVWYHDTTVGGVASDMKAEAHNYGTPVSFDEATVQQKTGKYKVKSGYVAYQLTETGVELKTVTTSEFAKESVKDYKFYKLNDVIKTGDCADAAKKQQLGLKCTVCGENLMVKDTESKDTKVIEETAAEHTYETTHVDATCEHPGQNVKTCKVCGAKVTTNIATEPQLAHSYKVEKKDADCTSAEVYTIYCTTCKNPVKEVVNIDTTKNVVVYKDAKDSKTVLWTGYNDELKGKDQIELTFTKKALRAHTYGADGEISPATCEKDAVYGKKCKDCGKVDASSVYTKTGTKLGHKFVTNEVKATCGTAGYKTEICENCGEYKADPAKFTATTPAPATTKDVEKALRTQTAKPVVALGAQCTFDKVVVLKDSTVFEEGVRTFECSKCGARDTAKESIAKKTVGKPVVTLKAGKKAFTVKASADNATGYKVVYKRAGKKAITKVVNADKLAKTYKKLAKGKKYTVKVTAFASNGTDTVYGATTTKTVKTK